MLRRLHKGIFHGAGLKSTTPGCEEEITKRAIAIFAISLLIIVEERAAGWFLSNPDISDHDSNVKPVSFAQPAPLSC